MRESFEWVLHNPEYLSWRDGEQVGLLWIKGGAGKGKTMMSIGLVEELSKPQQGSSIVIYFFCQNADSSLNTVEAIVKGLIFRLVKERAHVVQELRDQWDEDRGRFTSIMNSEELWAVFLAILDRCKREKVLVVVDALDECLEGVEQFLRHVVSTGLDRPGLVKWLLTSRPLDSAEQILLARSNQRLVSLEVNLNHVAQSVAAYVSTKVAELSRNWPICSPELQLQIEKELTRKAEGTFLWVSLVCKELRKVRAEDALAAIKRAPTGLQAIYERAYQDLCRGQSIHVDACVRLLDTMMLAYRPLTVVEAGNLLDLELNAPSVQDLIDRCASFTKARDERGVQFIEFVHQSARDFLAMLGESSAAQDSVPTSHVQVLERCLSCLRKSLTANILSHPDFGSTSEQILRNGREPLAGLGYAAEFWIRHFEAGAKISSSETILTAITSAEEYLRSHLLEWLEYLALVDQLPCASDGTLILLRVIHEIENVSAYVSFLSQMIIHELMNINSATTLHHNFLCRMYSNF